MTGKVAGWLGLDLKLSARSRNTDILACAFGPSQLLCGSAVKDQSVTLLSKRSGHFAYEPR